MSRERILMVVRPSKGGAFGHAVRLSRALAERGFDAAICGPHDQSAAADVEVIRIEIPRRPHPLHHSAAVARLAGVYRRWRPDLVHAHGSQGGALGRLARLRHPRTPLVFTPHNFAFKNYFANPLERGAYRAIEIGLAPLTTRVIAVCEAERRVATTVGLGKRTRVVYNGIEPLAPAAPDPDVARLAKRGPLICTVAEMQAPKGVTSLIAALPKLLERFPDAGLYVAGDGVERERLEQQVDELGVGAAVALPGSIANVAGLLGACDVFVQPGWSESFPYSILEAMGFGLPIVATDVGGVGEAIEDGVTGRLVAAKDPGQLADATIELLSDRERAAALGEAARERMMSRFRLGRMIDETIGVYREIGLG